MSWEIVVSIILLNLTIINVLFIINRLDKKIKKSFSDTIDIINILADDVEKLKKTCKIKK